MNILSKIYSLSPKIEHCEDETRASISFLGQEFVGWATLHPDDQDFQSNLIGASIAHMRALMSCFEFYTCKYEQDYLLLKDLVGQAKYVNNTGATEFLTRKMWRAHNRMKLFQAARKEMKTSLCAYLKGQEKAFETLRRIIRAKEDNK